jgi:hypothetical protein
MELIVGTGEKLLIRTSKDKGIDFTFKHAAWLTWPFEKFSRFLATLSSVVTTYRPLMISRFFSIDNGKLSDIITVSFIAMLDNLFCNIAKSKFDH